MNSSRVAAELTSVINMMKLSLLLLACVAVFAAPVPAAQQYHVVEVKNNKAITSKALGSMLTEKLGATKDKVQGLLEKLEQKGRAIMIAGSKAECKKHAKMFVNLGYGTVVKQLDDRMHGAKYWIQLYTTPPTDGAKA